MGDIQGGCARDDAGQGGQAQTEHGGPRDPREDPVQCSRGPRLIRARRRRAPPPRARARRYPHAQAARRARERRRIHPPHPLLCTPHRPPVHPRRRAHGVHRVLHPRRRTRGPAAVAQIQRTLRNHGGRRRLRVPNAGRRLDTHQQHVLPREDRADAGRDDALVGQAQASRHGHPVWAKENARRWRRRRPDWRGRLRSLLLRRQAEPGRLERTHQGQQRLSSPGRRVHRGDHARPDRLGAALDRARASHRRFRFDHHRGCSPHADRVHGRGVRAVHPRAGAQAAERVHDHGLDGPQHAGAAVGHDGDRRASGQERHLRVLQRAADRV
mmetsp:Transcript_6341/g.28648  ORF Transcript_6341/g.28648 Transcript_6341/m.28648 type:complete len:327 (+) Transcript_6341:1010-1990(+)